MKQPIDSAVKEILYRCLEQIQATKAALYLAEGTDRYELKSSYGYPTAKKTITQDDPILTPLAMRREPYIVNSLNDEPALAETLFESSTERMLVAPIYNLGKLVAVIDMRDKAGKRPFEQDDIRKSQTIVEAFRDLFTRHGMFGMRPVTLTGVDPSTAEGSVAAQASVIVERAKRAVALPPSDEDPEILYAHDFDAMADVLAAALAVENIVMASFGAAGDLAPTFLIASAGPLSGDAEASFRAKVAASLEKRGLHPPEGRTRVIHPHGENLPPVIPARLVTVLTAPIGDDPRSPLVFSIAFDRPADADAKRKLEPFLALVGRVLEHSRLGRNRQQAAQATARHLIEPDFQSFSQLRQHSDEVTALVRRFTEHLGLPRQERETIAIAAAVHDAGMRLLDYHRLYRKEHLSTEQLNTLRQHPIVGAALVRDMLGEEIAKIVLSHHERPDGTGYPNRLKGDRIPPGSRIIAICDAFVTMTSSATYKPPVSRAQALDAIRIEAGKQFDAELTERFETFFRQDGTRA